MAALGEAIEVIRKVWSGERNLRYDGHYHHLAGAQSGPTPAHEIGIWLGAYGPRALRLTARSADGWVPSLQGELQPVVDMVNRLDDAAGEAGRDPGEIGRILNVNGTITDGTSAGYLKGPVDHWVGELTGLVVEHGFDTFVLWAEGDDQVARFANEVASAVREQVASRRS